ncbi:hypothetical protein Cgig2_005543 [Carnegiea gigantea]|uniref:Uncharacterized protein n=1 Tax=Carnegiea gigantea TaxID=171969 RepID=A0A9Q1QQ22_9CARY|nr:hypothetical protein Cgig2_005543 [Carnegiea gigantea]
MYFVQDISQPIIYEWKPIKCTSCKMFGHEDSQCTRKKTTTAVWVTKEGTSQPQKESNSSEPRLVTQQTEAQQAEDNEFATTRRAARQLTVQGDNTPILNSFAALVYIISMSAQLIHAHARHGSANDAKDREMLWSKLGHISNTISSPWIACGDFNNVLHTNERMRGQQVSHTEVNALKRCMDACSLFELKQKAVSIHGLINMSIVGLIGY